MEAELKAYNEKRNFNLTDEPKGSGAEGGEGELRFVVQLHLARRKHYDFRLEYGGALLSWAVPEGPSYNPAVKRLAIRVEDHPYEYKDFEGTIPKGQYGGGTVMIWDEGEWEPRADVRDGLEKGSLKLTLFGQRLKGNWALVRFGKEKDNDNWLLIKEKDEFALGSHGISGFSASARSGRTIAEIEKGDKKSTANPFKATAPELAKLAERFPESGEWLYELKYDGYRIIGYAEDGKVKLESRGGNDYSEKFKEITQKLAALSRGRSFALDGEAVIADPDGRTDFQALQNYLKRGKNKGQSLTYVVFDLLALDGRDLRGKPLKERKAALEKLLETAPPGIVYSKHFKGKGKELLSAACAKGLEGVVGKRADSSYSGSRNGDWIKLKCGNRQEFVIGGFTRTEKKTEGVSAVLLGLYEGENLVYSGRAGTGFSEQTGRELAALFGKLERKSPPFVNPPKGRTGEETFWLKPELVAEIRFAEWTDAGQLRQASFKGLRRDKPPKDVKREVPQSPETRV